MSEFQWHSDSWLCVFSRCQFEVPDWRPARSHREESLRYQSPRRKLGKESKQLI
jgi:hypothetical protein